MNIGRSGEIRMGERGMKRIQINFVDLFGFNEKAYKENALGR